MTLDEIKQLLVGRTIVDIRGCLQEGYGFTGFITLDDGTKI
jgi:hypothetical protein